MFGFNSLFIVTQALVLMGLLYVFARQEADFEFSTTVLVMCGIIAGNAMLIMLLVERLGLFVAIPSFFFTCWVIVKFCWVSWPKGLLITALFFVLSLGIEIGKTWYRTGQLPWNTVETRTEEAMSNYERDMQEGMEVLKEINESTERMQAAARGEPLPPVELAPGRTTGAAASAPAKTATAPLPPPPAPVAAVPAAPPPVVPAAPVVAAVPPPVAPVAPAAPAVPPARPQATDWVMAKSRLRIRGWVESTASERSVMVNDQVVPLGGTAYIDHLGLRYTWKLATLDGYAPGWEPVDAVPIPKSP